MSVKWNLYAERCRNFADGSLLFGDDLVGHLDDKW